MKILTQLTFLFALCLLGDLIASALPFAFPGSVLAMLALLVLLGIRAVKPQALEPVSGFLLGNMPLLFVAPMVMVLDHLDALRGRALAILLVCAVSTLAAMASAALTVSFVLRLTGGASDE